jgi:hypothetical protein
MLGLELWPRWAVTWLLALLIFSVCKWLTWWRTCIPDISCWRHVGYFLAWPGLDAPAFLDPRRVSPRPSSGEWCLAICNLSLGLALVLIGRHLVADKHLRGWTGMVGIVLVLHFGLFHLLSCVWRQAGVEARPLMNWPILSLSVSEFWSKRWNTAFRDLTHRFLFRPLSGRLGPRAAVLVGFAVSGVIHDLVISVPAGAGYGGPTVFFLLQGVAVLSERSSPGRTIGLGRGLSGQLFTAAVLLVPVSILFPPAFVVDVVVPFLEAL